MKLCKIISHIRVDNAAKNLTIVLLCDSCYQSDTKRGFDAQVINYYEFISEFNVSCEICYKSFKEEREEKS